MEEGVKSVLKIMRALLLAIAAGAILITLANYLPVNPEIRQRSLEQLSAEGYFPEVPSMQGGYGDFHSMNPTTLELATDGLMVEMALYQGEDEGIIQAFRCFSTQASYHCEYSRYWHGYVVILRFLMMFFDYYEIRLLNGLAQMLIACFIVHLLVKNGAGVKGVLAFLTSFFLLMPSALAQCLQYSWIYYVAFGALLIYLEFKSYVEQKDRYLCFFLIVGAATAYLDLLTYPLFTWGFVIVWWILLQEKRENAFGYLRKVVFSGISWIIGYAGMWAGKWAMGSLVLGKNLFRDALDEMLLWTLEGREDPVTLGDRLYSVYLNWETYSYKLYYVILAAWLLYMIYKGLGGYRKESRLPALLLIGCSSLVWYMTLADHALMHHIFTHRTYGVAIAAFLGIVLVGTEGKMRLAQPGKWLKNGCFLAAWGVLSLFLMLQLRSDYTVNNHSHGYDFEKHLAVGSVTMPFTPDFSRVIEIGIGVHVEDGTAGEYKISLLDGEEVLYEEKAPVSEWAEGNLHMLSVDWRLTPGKPYLLRLDQVDTDGNTYFWSVAEGGIPLAEYGPASIGEEEQVGQMLTEITYWCRPVGKYDCCFWMLTIMAMGLSVFVGLSPLADEGIFLLKRANQGKDCTRRNAS